MTPNLADLMISSDFHRISALFLVRIGRRAYIGWKHEHEHKQLVEIQQELNAPGILINKRNTDQLYRQFLGVMSTRTEARLEKVVTEHGGLIWALDALQPEGGIWRAGLTSGQL